MKRRIAAGTVIALAVLTGCADKEDATQDAPVNQQLTDNTPAEVINFPDAYANVTTKCDHHGHRIYSTTREAPPVVVADPTCPTDWPSGGSR